MSKFKFVILTQCGFSFVEEIDKVIVSTTEGEITILKNHIPLIATTKKGRVVVFNKDQKIELLANPGVLKINNEETILLSDKVEVLK